jgi:hypothetical protein
MDSVRKILTDYFGSCIHNARVAQCTDRQSFGQVDICQGS